jgi:hypothetical protein
MSSACTSLLGAHTNTSHECRQVFKYSFKDSANHTCDWSDLEGNINDAVSGYQWSGRKYSSEEPQKNAQLVNTPFSEAHNIQAHLPVRVCIQVPYINIRKHEYGILVHCQQEMRMTDRDASSLEKVDNELRRLHFLAYLAHGRSQDAPTGTVFIRIHSAQSNDNSTPHAF